MATRAISPGETISSEVAAVLGPPTISKPQCLQCFQLLSSSSQYKCKLCGYPLCGKECMLGNLHRLECKVFREAGIRANVRDLGAFDKQYSAITVLRLLLCEEEKATGNYGDHAVGIVDTLEDHDDEIQIEQKDTWKLQKELIVDFIQKVKMSGIVKCYLIIFSIKRCKLVEKYSEKKIRQAVGVLMTNSTNLQLSPATHGVGVGLFPVYAMGNHSCM